MNKYDKFNDMNVDINDYNMSAEDEENFKINDIEKRNILNNIKGKKKSKLKRNLVIVAACFALIFSFSLTEPGSKALAKVQMYLEEIFLSDTEIHGDARKGKYASKINETVKFGEAEIKLLDAIVYNNKLTLSTLIKLPDDYNKNRNEIPVFKEVFIKINGKEYFSPGASASVGKNNEKDDYYISSNDIYLSKDLPKGKYDIEVIYDGLQYLYKDGFETFMDEKATIVGQVDTELVEKTQKKFKIDKTLKTEAFDFTVEEIVTNPLETKISGSLKNIDLKIINDNKYDLTILNDYGEIASSSNSLISYSELIRSKENEGTAVFRFENLSVDAINLGLEDKKEIKLQFGKYVYDEYYDVNNIEPIGEPFTIKLK